MELTQQTGLVVVDVQRDFLLEGTLPVPRSNEVVATASRLAEGFHAAGLLVACTRAWLPADHKSFRGHGGQLPVHCVQDTHGAEFADDLVIPPDTWILSKGTNRTQSALSAFDGTDFGERLRKAGIETLLICGLATETGVKHTVLDALESGFGAYIVADACRPFNKHVGDGARSVEEMLRAGARIVSSGAVRNALETFSATE
ncbi:MAG TPA: isochorismatase family protein [Candidatus Krumholzibacteria bacterium]|nr:isochorismatase family protein [Candidatus Krumholzibacteria bacterium]